MSTANEFDVPVRVEDEDVWVRDEVSSTGALGSLFKHQGRLRTNNFRALTHPWWTTNVNPEAGRDRIIIQVTKRAEKFRALRLSQA